MQIEKSLVYRVFLNEKLNLIGFMITKSVSAEREYDRFFGFKEVVGNFKEVRHIKNFAKKNNLSCKIYISNIGFENAAYQYSDVLRYLKEEGNSSVFVCLDNNQGEELKECIQNYEVSNFFLTQKQDSMGVIFDTLSCIRGLN